MGESLVYTIKIALAVAASMAFVVAIITLMSFIISLGTSSILGEIFGLISVYLPFNPALIFGTISTTIIGIIAFLIARKVWNITGATYKMS